MKKTVLDEIKKSVQALANKVGVTGQFTAALGKGDGTNTIIYEDDISRRLVWCHEPTEPGAARKTFLAVLGEGSGISFMNAPGMEGMEVKLGYPPNSNQLHVLGMTASAYYGTGGQTVQDQVTQTAIRPPADAIITMRVEATFPATTSILVYGPFMYLKPSTGEWKSFEGGSYNLSTRIAALGGAEHQLCLMCFDPENGTLIDLVNTASTAGDTTPVRTAFGIADILGFTIRNYTPLGAVYLYAGQLSAGISESDIYRTYPTRPMFQSRTLNKLNATAAPGVGDDSGDGYVVGSVWVDTTNDVTYICTDSTVGAAVWKQTSNATVYYQTVQDEGTPVTQRATINFTGTGVSVADNSGSSRTDVTISTGAITVEESDGAPSVASVTKIKFSNGTVTDDGGGVVSVNNASSSSLTVKEEDGTPSVSSVTEIKVTNATLTDNGGGSVSINIASGSGDSTTRQAYASRPAAGNDGNLSFYTNANVIERDNGATWDTFGPIYPFTVPSDPGTWVNQGSATITAEYGALTFYVPGNSTDLRLRVKTAPAAPYTVTMAFIPQMVMGGNPMMGMVWRDSASGKVQPFALTYNAGHLDMQTQNWSSYTTASFVGTYRSLTSANAPGLGGLVWLRLKDDNTNRECWYSGDGIHWIKFHGHARTTYFTPDQVGILVRAATAQTDDEYMIITSWLEA